MVAHSAHSGCVASQAVKPGWLVDYRNPSKRPRKAVCAKAGATSPTRRRCEPAITDGAHLPDPASVAVCGLSSAGDHLIQRRRLAFAIARYPIISYVRLVASLSHGAAGNGRHAAEILVFVARLCDMEKAASVSGLFS
jgi:hypothetical protein